MRLPFEHGGFVHHGRHRDGTLADGKQKRALSLARIPSSSPSQVGSPALTCMPCSIPRYLPFHLIHGPNEVPEKFVDLYPRLDPARTAASQGMCGVCECADQSEGRDVGKWDLLRGGDATWHDCRTVLGMAAALDWAVGSVVDAIKANGHWDNTVIFYTSDNGAQQGQGGTSMPLRGWKTQLYEGGVRVPGFVSGGSPLLPQEVRGTINSKLYHVTDLLPTIVALAGGGTHKNQPLDGFNIWPSIVSQQTSSPRKEILLNMNPACGKGFVNPNAGLRVGDWKLLVDCFNTTTLAPNDMNKVEL